MGFVKYTNNLNDVKTEPVTMMDLDSMGAEVVEVNGVPCVVIEKPVAETESDKDTEKPVIYDRDLYIDDTGSVVEADFSWFGDVKKKFSKTALGKGLKKLDENRPERLIASAFEGKKSKYKTREVLVPKQNISKAIVAEGPKNAPIEIQKIISDETSPFDTSWLEAYLKKASKFKAPCIAINGVQRIAVLRGRKELKYDNPTDMESAIKTAADGEMDKFVRPGRIGDLGHGGPGAAYPETLAGTRVFGALLRISAVSDDTELASYEVSVRDGAVEQFAVQIFPSKQVQEILLFSTSMGNSKGSIKGSADFNIVIAATNIVDGARVDLETLTDYDLGT